MERALMAPGEQSPLPRQDRGDHGLASLVRDAVSRAFDKISCQSVVTAEVKAGPTGLRISFTSEALARCYLQSFVSEPPSSIDLSIAVLDANDIDLSELVPEPAERGRTFVDDRCMAMWYADRRPVLYLLDRRKGQSV